MAIFGPPQPRLRLGSYTNSFPLWPSHLELEPAQLASHKHLIGTTGMGKTGLLKGIVWQLIRMGTGVSFIDPHGDAVEDVLAMLIQFGYFRQPGAFDRVWYVEFTDDPNGHFIPFNWLNQPHLREHTRASNVVDAFHRVWPALSDGSAPAFDSSVKYGAKILISNGLTLPALTDVLTNKDYRDPLLAAESDPDIAKFFQWLDNLPKQEQSTQTASAFRRIELLSFSPALKFTLGQQENLLDFRKIMDEGICVLYNLHGIRDRDARKLIGALITIGYEEAALARDQAHRREHHLVIDEAPDVISKSEEALVTMLSETRKYRLFLAMAHQTWQQLDRRLQGALQNVGVEMCLRVGREDAELMAKWLGVVNPMEVKSQTAAGTTQYLSLPEQWEGWTHSLAHLPERHVLVKLAGRPTVEIRTMELPRVTVKREDLEVLKAEYRRRLMKPASEIVLPHQVRPAREGPKTYRRAPL